MNNELVRLIQSHRSIRKYSDDRIPDEIFQELYRSAQWTPSSHNVQAYTIIAVKNQEAK
jgi:nitroreductase